MDISTRMARAILRTFGGGALRIPTDVVPPQYRKSVYISITDVNPKNIVVRFYSDSALSSPINLQFPHNDPHPIDLDLYGYANGDVAVRVFIVLADQKARFDSTMKDAITAGDEHSQDFFRNLEFSMLDVAGTPEPVCSFICIMGGAGKGKLLSFNMSMMVTNVDGSEAPFGYDPKIKNNGLVCDPGDEFSFPECM